MIVASAPEADAPPDALADGAATDTADSAPDALALTDPPPPTGTNKRVSRGANICHGLARRAVNSVFEIALDQIAAK